MDPGEFRSQLDKIGRLSLNLRNSITEAMKAGRAAEYKLLSWRIQEDFRTYAEEDLSGGPAWGIEWLEARDGRIRLINAVNLLRSENTISWIGMDPENAIDLLTGQNLEEEMVIRPLDPLLIEITGQ